MAAWTLEIAVDLLRRGALAFHVGDGEERQRDPELVDSFEAIPAAIRDAILMQPLLRSYYWDRCDWVSDANMSYFTEENREAVLRQLVAIRLRMDKALPTWLYYACAVCVKNGWDVPSEWIDRLRAAIVLADAGMECRFRKGAQKWLECWDGGHPEGTTVPW